MLQMMRAVLVLGYGVWSVSAAVTTVVNRRDTNDNGVNIDASNFLRRRYHATTLAGKYLYIDGGQVSYSDGSYAVPVQENATLSIDMSQDWSNSTVKFNQISRPDDMVLANVEALFYHQSENVIYNGPVGDMSIFGKKTPPAPAIWTLQPDGKGGGSWSQKYSSTAPQLKGFRRSTRGPTAQSPDAGFVLNGQDVAGGNYLPGMVRIDMGAETKLTNVTTTTPPIQEGGLQYVPTFGKKGVLVAFPGQIKKPNLPDTPFPTQALPDDLNALSVYDIDSGTWFSQNTSGIAPKPRSWFCVAGAQSTNNTFEIMFYGGYVVYGDDAGKYDDLHILTLPAFRWIPTQFTGVSRRYGHTCDSVGGSQILVTGGGSPSQFLIDTNNPWEKDLGNFSNLDRNAMRLPDGLKQGLGVYDLTAQDWADGYRANPGPYKQSTDVAEYYSSNAATKPYEKDYNPKWAALVASSSNSASNTSSASSSQPTSPTKKKSNAGAIAGGVVGGIAALAILAFLAWFLLRRRKAKKLSTSHQTSPEMQDTSTEKDHHSLVNMNGDSKLPPAEMGHKQWDNNGQHAMSEMDTKSPQEAMGYPRHELDQQLSQRHEMGQPTGQRHELNQSNQMHEMDGMPGDRRSELPGAELPRR